MDQTKLAAAFNEWMRRYTDEPEKFDREWKVVSEFLAEKHAGQEPNYGQTCAAYLIELMQ